MRAGQYIGLRPAPTSRTAPYHCTPTRHTLKWPQDRGRRVDRPRITRADVHIIGEIMGASGFSTARHALFCRYRLVYDGIKSWTVVRGSEAGCTQVS